LFVARKQDRGPQSGQLTRLVYIGGYGRSGSTLLESLLTTCPDVVTCGEVARSRLRRAKKKRRCTCGQLTEDCWVWSAFHHSSQGLHEGSHEDLTLALLEHVSGDYAIMVDSSKTAWVSAGVPFNLRRKLSENFYLIHIVRDPRAVCWSTMKPRPNALQRPATQKAKKKRQAGKASSMRALRFLLTVVGWTIANLSCELFGWMYPRQYQRVRYEDLVGAPGAMVESLLDKILSVPCDRRAADFPRDNRHQLHGNRTRFQVRTLSVIKEDGAWRTEMPSTYRWLAMPLSWPLCSRYGYARGTS
jgi:hypothetical protein